MNHGTERCWPGVFSKEEPELTFRTSWMTPDHTLQGPHQEGGCIVGSIAGTQNQPYRWRFKMKWAWSWLSVVCACHINTRTWVHISKTRVKPVTACLWHQSPTMMGRQRQENPEGLESTSLVYAEGRGGGRDCTGQGKRDEQHQDYSLTSICVEQHMSTWTHAHKCTATHINAHTIYTLYKSTHTKTSVNKMTKAFGNITGAVWSSSLQLSAVFHTTSLCSLVVKISRRLSNAMNFRTLQPPPEGTEEQRLMPICASSWCGTRHNPLGGKGSVGESLPVLPTVWGLEKNLCREGQLLNLISAG